MPIIQGKPPERKTTARKPSAPAPTLTSKREQREEAVRELADMASVGLMMAKQPADAGAISQHSPAIAHEIALIADTDEKIAGFLDRLSTVGPYAGLAKAVLPLALQLAVNHKRLPETMAGTMGVMRPDDLSAMVELKAEKLKAEMEKELAQVRREMAELNGNAVNPRSSIHG